jgi:hypothetical protein
LPTVIVTAAITHKSAAQSGGTPRRVTVSTRINAAKAPAFEPVAISAVTLVGAPWYTSGTHMWKGTDEILKPNPTIRSPSPIANIGSRGREASAAAMRSRFVVPVVP